MPTVTIASNSFPSYTSSANADLYLSADIERSVAWGASTADDKGRALASATRLLGRLVWAAGAAPLTDGSAPQVVADACCLLAGDMIASPDVYSVPSTASNIRDAGAGPAKVSFFRPTAGTPLPPAAWDLIKSLLGGSSQLTSAAYGASYGTDPCDSTSTPSRFGLGGPYN